MDSVIISAPSLQNTQYVLTGKEEKSHHAMNPIFLTVCGVMISAAICTGASSTPLHTDTINQKCVSVYNDSVRVDGYALAAESPLEFCKRVDWTFFEEFSPIHEDNKALDEQEAPMVNKGIPTSFVVCGMGFFALFAFFAYALISGAAAGSFLMNPVYLFELAFGFFGLTATVVAAIIEWRKKRDWKERNSR